MTVSSLFPYICLSSCVMKNPIYCSVLFPLLKALCLVSTFKLTKKVRNCRSKHRGETSIILSNKRQVHHVANFFRHLNLCFIQKLRMHNVYVIKVFKMVDLLLDNSYVLGVENLVQLSQLY